MAKLLMITGLGSAIDLASGKKGAFYNTLEEFSKYWDRIDIICPRIDNCKLKIFDNVYIHISPWPLIFHPFWFLKKGMQIYKEQKFDLMTAHDFPPFYNGIGARLLWWKIRVPYVLEIHHIPGYPKGASFKESIYRNLMRWFIRFDSSMAIAVRVVNQIQVPEFIIQSGVSRGKIVYIPSMYIDLDIFKPMDLIKEYDIIFVGRLVENKGVELLIEASRKLKEFKIIIVGKGEKKIEQNMRSKIKKWGLNIIFHGYAKDSEEIAKLLNESKMLVMPSYNEGGPRVVLEAMACGVPVLATNIGLIPDFVDKNAIKIIDWNAEDIAQKIKELLKNEEERKRLSRAGLEIAKQFEKKEAIKNYADKLKQLI